MGGAASTNADTLERAPENASGRISIPHRRAASQMSREIVHHRVACDGCQMAPLRGERYRCTSCEDFDLCETCHEARADIHNTSHTFRLVPVSGVRHRGWRHRGTSAASEMIEGPLSASRLDLLLSAAGEDLFEPLGTFGDLGAIASSGRSASNSNRLARRERRQQQQRRLRGGAGTNIVTFNAADPSRVFQHMARGNFEQPSPLQIGQLHRLFEELQMLRMILDSHATEQPPTAHPVDADTLRALPVLPYPQLPPEKSIKSLCATSPAPRSLAAPATPREEEASGACAEVKEQEMPGSQRGDDDDYDDEAPHAEAKGSGGAEGGMETRGRKDGPVAEEKAWTTTTHDGADAKSGEGKISSDDAKESPDRGVFEAAPEEMILDEGEEKGKSCVATQCVICIDTFRDGEPVLHMPCSHVFHEQCIIAWFQENNKCPMCRFALKEDEAVAKANEQNRISSERERRRGERQRNAMARGREGRSGEATAAEEEGELIIVLDPPPTTAAGGTAGGGGAGGSAGGGAGGGGGSGGSGSGHSGGSGILRSALREARQIADAVAGGGEHPLEVPLEGSGGGADRDRSPPPDEELRQRQQARAPPSAAGTVASGSDTTTTAMVASGAILGAEAEEEEEVVEEVAPMVLEDESEEEVVQSGMIMVAS